ncbi:MULTISPECIES: DNA mismatch repair endonuclease MutL [Duncaniella]|jgi:DNA mismatch repair protein MutL|uniref:DNA mismatch repair protein MutL n=2 Tax=Duncaniella TaxID=2518495 RepID=A0A4P7W3P2_9BACT|nr:MULTISPECIES: DNA mismatch repair endonuclease MutL [Duncaniella]MBJ2190441.1 DNA mismatch repair endonuclease MutL [Muribaculaceae bacterium]MCX4283157.1 DNA mismatch repair endonuclease MutL [Duncaniella dubosii]QCD42050.1 DNA mismatch repair endonuclease MutL [Duncaniella dubosii]HBN62971.1 DNA mismatch repair endonuclease MutL [Porphyromonadaceae bacterium]
MSDIIRLLPDSVANQIAAGEVIQRPASVIKELVENSIDAGATSVTIILKDAGRTLIQVIDNGCGMSDTDARLAFERHATSKIRKADDLFSLSTMGFRGEALASIAAIAQVDLRTMLKGETIGTRLVINGSKVESQEPEACAQGSNLMVKNLFFNVPARRKFLKKDSVELSNIMREFERLALVNIGVDFTLISNDVTLHSLRRASLKQRIADLFGRSLDKQIVPLDTDTSIVRINGFIGLPENARKRNALQYLMVNGRNMRHPYFHKAIMQCYERLITADVQPNYFINLTVDPETIDVNIHPTKSEIKFENEQAIWQILTAAVRESLGRFNAAPAIDFDVDEAPEIPVFSPDIDADHEVILEEGYNPFSQPAHATRSSSLSGMGSSVSGLGTSESRKISSLSVNHAHTSERFQDWEKLYDDFVKKRDDGYASMVESKVNRSESELELDNEAPVSATLQLKNSYILTPSRDGLMIIDQHRAHKRILYDSYLAKVKERDMVCQNTMFPEIVELSPAQNAVLADIAPSLEDLGFAISPLGDNSWSITGIPSMLGGANPRDLLLGMIESVTETGEELASSLQERIALSMARSSAIKRGQVLSATEMDKLISDLFRLSTPARTPDGKTVFTIVNIEDISKMLG